LKHVVNVLVCDDRQRWIPSHTKLSRFIPSQHWTTRVTRVETLSLFVHWVALWYLFCTNDPDSYITFTYKEDVQLCIIMPRYVSVDDNWDISVIFRVFCYTQLFRKGKGHIPQKTQIISAKDASLCAILPNAMACSRRQNNIINMRWIYSIWRMPVQVFKSKIAGWCR